ncbi:hypothetical protein ACP3V3_19700 [Vibrio sp. PNB22_3_1]
MQANAIPITMLAPRYRKGTLEEVLNRVGQLHSSLGRAGAVDLVFAALPYIEEGRITLEPEFFTIEDDDGNTTQPFNLILKIKDLD